MSTRWQHIRRIDLLGAHTADVGIVLLICSAIFATLISFNPTTSLTQGFRLCLGVLLYYVILYFVRDKRRIFWMVTALIFAGVLLALIAAFSVRWITFKIPLLPPALYQHFEIIFADTIHPNVLAGYLLLSLPLPLAVLLFAWNDMKAGGRILMVGVGFAMSLMLVLSQSRGGGLAAVLGLCVLVGLRWRRIGLMLALLLGLGLWSAWTYPPLQAKLVTVYSFTSLESRQEIWKRAGYLIQDFPLGVGLGLYGEMVDRFYPFFHSLPGGISHAHNLFLQIAVDLGLPGLFAWWVIVLAMLTMAWRIFRTGQGAQDSWWSAWGAGLLCSQIAMLLHGLVDAVTWGMVRPAPLVWVLWGTIVAGYRVKSPQPVKLRMPIGLGLVAATWLLSFGAAGWQSGSAYRALLALRQVQTPAACSMLAPMDFSGLTVEIKTAIGGFLLSVGCQEAAANILPPYTTHLPRADLAAYHWGRAAWMRGDELQAASYWRMVSQVNPQLVLLAQDAMREDVFTAMRWFDAAIRSASSPSHFVEALLAYEDAMRASRQNPEFCTHLAVLRDELGPDTAKGHRLEAERLHLLGDMAEASEQLSQAIAGGLDDSETWLLLGYVSLQQDRLAEAETAYRNALQAPIMVAARRPWYLSQLARLLARQARLAEALAYQQEAAQLSGYYEQWDYLSTLYAQLGDTAQARQACEKAHSLAQDSAAALTCQR